MELLQLYIEMMDNSGKVKAKYEFNDENSLPITFQSGEDKVKIGISMSVRILKVDIYKLKLLWAVSVDIL